jgi:IS30 family transposase
MRMAGIHMLNVKNTLLDSFSIFGIETNMQRKKRYVTRERRCTIPNQVSIEQRPALIDQPSRYGDWEGDLMIGANHRQALVTLNERKSRYSFIGMVVRKSADAVSDTIISVLTPCSAFVHALNTDKGKEFAQHERTPRV